MRSLISLLRQIVYFNLPYCCNYFKPNRQLSVGLTQILHSNFTQKGFDI